jgi:hypothetical protein
MRLGEVILGDHGWVCNHSTAVPVARSSEARRRILAEQRDVRRVNAVAHGQRAAGIGVIGDIGECRIRGEADVAKIDLILAAEAFHRAGEAVRVIEDQLAGFAGKLHRLGRG